MQRLIQPSCVRGLKAPFQSRSDGLTAERPFVDFLSAAALLLHLESAAPRRAFAVTRERWVERMIRR
jgi:hypothetical protein